MKKILGVCIMVGVLASSGSTQAVESAALMSAFGNVAAKLLTSMPQLIQDLPKFLDDVKLVRVDFQANYKKILTMPATTKEEKALKDQELKKLFVTGVKLLIDINNISDNILGIVKEFGPVITALDTNLGPKVETVVQQIIDIIFMFSRIAQGVQRIISEELHLQLPANQAKVIKTSLVSDDL